MRIQCTSPAPGISQSKPARSVRDNHANTRNIGRSGLGVTSIGAGSGRVNPHTRTHARTHIHTKLTASLCKPRWCRREVAQSTADLKEHRAHFGRSLFDHSRQVAGKRSKAKKRKEKKRKKKKKRR
jgi:hypothetical protein